MVTDTLMVTLERVEAMVTGTLIALLIFFAAFAICLIVIYFLPGDKKDPHRRGLEDLG